MKIPNIELDRKLTRTDIIHHWALVSLFFIISFFSIGSIWDSIELFFNFKSELVWFLFFWVNFGFVYIFTNRVFIPMKLKFKYFSLFFVSIILILFLFMVQCLSQQPFTE